jgi:hypothetical protein
MIGRFNRGVFHRGFSQRPTQHITPKWGHPRVQGLLSDFCAPQPNACRTTQNYQQLDMTRQRWWQYAGNSDVVWIQTPNPWAGFATGLNIQGQWGDRWAINNTFRWAAPFTVEVVMMCPNAPGYAANGHAICSKSGGTLGDSITFMWDDGGYYNESHKTSWQSYIPSLAAYKYLAYSPLLVQNVWYDLVATVDAANNLTIYQNGNRNGSLALGGAPDADTTGTHSCYIGAYTSHGFTGEVGYGTEYVSIERFWNRVLAPDEIRDLYYWPYDHYALN